MNSEKPPNPIKDAADAAEELRSRCAVLADSLSALRRVPSDEVEEAIGRHLKTVEPVCERIEQLVRRLPDNQEFLRALSPEDREALLARVRESRRVIQEAGAQYGRLVEAVRHVQASIRHKLRRVQQGGKVLRSYRDGADMTG